MIIICNNRLHGYPCEAKTITSAQLRTVNVNTVTIHTSMNAIKFLETTPSHDFHVGIQNGQKLDIQFGQITPFNCMHTNIV